MPTHFMTTMSVLGTQLTLKWTTSKRKPWNMKKNWKLWRKNLTLNDWQI